MQIVDVAEAGVAHLAQLLPNCSYNVWLQVDEKDTSNCSFTTPPGPCMLSSTPSFYPSLPPPPSTSPSLLHFTLPRPPLLPSSPFYSPLPHPLPSLSSSMFCPSHLTSTPSLPAPPPLVNITITTLNGVVQLHWTLPQGAKVEIYLGDHWVDVTLGGVVTSLGNVHNVVVMVTLGNWTATSVISVPTELPAVSSSPALLTTSNDLHPPNCNQ